MPLFDEELRTYLISRAEIAAELGDRIYPLVKSQNPRDYPAVTYQVIADAPVRRLDLGPSGTVVDLYQFKVWGTSRGDCARIGRLLEEALTDAGESGLAAVNGSVQSVECMSRRDGPYTRALGLYCRIGEFQIWRKP